MPFLSLSLYHSAASIVSAIRWYRPPPRRHIRIRIRVDMIINILHRRISSRVTTDILTPLSLIHPHIVDPQLGGKNHRR